MIGSSKWIVLGLAALAFLAPTRTAQAVGVVGTGGSAIGQAITSLGSIKIEPAFAPRFSPDISPRFVPEIGLKTDFPDIDLPGLPDWIPWPQIKAPVVATGEPEDTPTDDPDPTEDPPREIVDTGGDIYGG